MIPVGWEVCSMRREEMVHWSEQRRRNMFPFANAKRDSVLCVDVAPPPPTARVLNHCSIGIGIKKEVQNYR